MATPAKTKTVPALKARTQLGRIMKEVQSGKVRVLVEKSGIPMVGIISADEFQRVITEREARFDAIDRIRRWLPSVSEAEIQQDVRDALKQVHRRRRVKGRTGHEPARRRIDVSPMSHEARASRYLPNRRWRC